MDRCFTKKCPSCKFNECNYKPNPKDECNYPDGFIMSGSCQDNNLTCYGFSCVNECERISCLPSYKCQTGTCVPEWNDHSKLLDFNTDLNCIDSSKLKFRFYYYLFLV